VKNQIYQKYLLAEESERDQFQKGGNFWKEKGVIFKGGQWNLTKSRGAILGRKMFFFYKKRGNSRKRTMQLYSI
jgi:hypothetical protein